jgi:hypothetical protein
LEDLENELEAYAPLIKYETKSEKTYYNCPMRAGLHGVIIWMKKHE